MLKGKENVAASTWAIVALKSPAGAKSRLRPYCPDEERRGLYYLMARRVLKALLAVPAIDKVLAVTASDEVAGFVQDLGGLVIRQPHDLGTQSAFAHALKRLQTCIPPRPARLVMISGDIPLITPAAVADLLDRCHARSGVTIVPDERRQGTNALVCSPPDALEPCFGEDSLRRHRAAAHARGLDVQVIESRGLSLDIDDHEDLISLSKRVADGPGFELDPGLSSWLDRYFARAAPALGVIESADC